MLIIFSSAAYHVPDGFAPWQPLPSFRITIQPEDLILCSHGGSFAYGRRFFRGDSQGYPLEKTNKSDGSPKLGGTGIQVTPLAILRQDGSVVLPVIDNSIANRGSHYACERKPILYDQALQDYTLDLSCIFYVLVKPSSLQAANNYYEAGIPHQMKGGIVEVFAHIDPLLVNSAIYLHQIAELTAFLCNLYPQCQFSENNDSLFFSDRRRSVTAEEKTYILSNAKLVEKLKADPTRKKLYTALKCTVVIAFAVCVSFFVKRWQHSSQPA
ncbi:MAG: hypothetical protein AAB323_00555 [Pseudomonadota bacterium]